MAAFPIGECRFGYSLRFTTGKAVGPRTSVSNPPITAKVIKRAMKAASRIVILGKPVAVDTAVAGNEHCNGIPLISLPITTKLRIPTDYRPIEKRIRERAYTLWLADGRWKAVRMNTDVKPARLWRTKF
jgi:hypothetical protein